MVNDYNEEWVWCEVVQMFFTVVVVGTRGLHIYNTHVVILFKPPVSQHFQSHGVIQN